MTELHKSPRFALRRTNEPDVFAVEVEDAIVGIVHRRQTLLSNLGKTKQATFAHGVLWQASPEGASLDDHDQRLLRRQLSRSKTNRRGAARYLLAAYEAAGVALPEAPSESAAA